MDIAPILAANRRAVARAISAVENRRPGGDDLLDALYPHTGNAWRVGITGPPGAGKSTLVNKLVHAFRDAGRTVAVVAVDPSSPFTGGAILGDRVRLAERHDDAGFFYRSLATRGALGGLSRQTEAAADVLDAAGFDVVLVETVGVGQGELDVAQAADTVAVVLVPESGDAVQAMKAGLMEIADVFAVNKADHPDADKLTYALEQMLHLRPYTEGDWTVPVVQTVATEAGGLHAFIDALDAHRAHLDTSGAWAAARADRLKRRVRALVRDAWTERFWTPARHAHLDTALAAADTALGPHALARQLLEEAESGGA